MIDCERITESLPAVVVSSVAPTPFDFTELPYSPSFLLPASFASLFQSSHVYARWCEIGFDGYLETVACGKLPVERAEDARACVFRVMTDDSGTLVESAGFVHGWLSALALTDRALAVRELAVVAVLVRHLVENGTC